MNKLYKIIFSPTGNSEFIADKMIEDIQLEKITIDLCKELQEDIQIDSDSLCVFSVPCYGGRIPSTVVDRLAHIHGKSTASIVCVSYGNRAFEDALLELANTVEANGFQVIGGCAAVAEHNIMHIYGTGRPNIHDINEIKEFSLKIMEKIEADIYTKPVIPGNFPYKQYHPSRANILVHKEMCSNCGLCAAKCPVSAISNDGIHMNTDLCINCMRCIHICPNKCRSLSDEFVSALIQKVGKACETRKDNVFYL